MKILDAVGREITLESILLYTKNVIFINESEIDTRFFTYRLRCTDYYTGQEFSLLGELNKCSLNLYKLANNILDYQGALKMNNRDKIVTAIDNFHSIGVLYKEAKVKLEQTQDKLAEAESNLTRTLHAVLGDRSINGVIYKGKRYKLDNNQLSVTDFECEILE